MAGRYWAPDEDKVLRELASFEHASMIAAKLGRTVDSVKHRAIALGISLRKHGDAHPGARYSDALIEQARRMHDAGHGPRYISRELGINEWTLRSALYYGQRRRPAFLASEAKGRRRA